MWYFVIIHSDLLTVYVFGVCFVGLSFVCGQPFSLRIHHRKQCCLIFLNVVPLLSNEEKAHTN